MKTFEERKEEVLRRSDVRIRRRNIIARNIAAVCIPLILTVAAVMLRPNFQITTVNPETGTSTGSTTPVITTRPGHGMGSQCSVTVSKNGQLLIHDDETAVEAILVSLEAICAREQEPVVENFGSDQQTTPSSLSWKITVLQDDTSTVYSLDGDRLMLNGKTWLLTESEKQTLCRLLGLPTM